MIGHTIRGMVLAAALLQFAQPAWSEERPLPKSKGRYVVILPKDYDAKKRYELMVPLHGMGDTPENFAAFWQQALGERPTLLAVPAPGNGNWGSADVERIAETVEDAVKTYSIDPRRVYLSGFSAGCAMGFYVLCKKPGLFTGYGGLGMALQRGLGSEQELGANAAACAIYYAVGKRDPNHRVFQPTVDMLNRLRFNVKAEDPDVGHTITPGMCKNMLEFFHAAAEKACASKVSEAKKLLAEKKGPAARKLLAELAAGYGATADEAGKLLKDLDEKEMVGQPTLKDLAK